uniref:Uncharacterized protein n=1 Tax=Pipistrellus kuhlii TaxID=59472 RepID=A0A7J7Y933_PIPKU|nr:hypothetical protein mPipKuh1_010291 [Pipistrellus kuhlii]
MQDGCPAQLPSPPHPPIPNQPVPPKLRVGWLANPPPLHGPSPRPAMPPHVPGAGGTPGRLQALHWSEAKVMAVPGLETPENLSSDQRLRPSRKVPAGTYGSKCREEAEHLEPATLASAHQALGHTTTVAPVGERGRAGSWGAELGGT